MSAIALSQILESSSQRAAPLPARMPTVYTLTPNPVLDLSGVVEHIIPNEKNYVLEEKRFPGGNSVNVARLLSKFSIPVVATGFLGGGIGEEFQKLLDSEGVPHDFVKIKGDTRISVTVSVQKNHQQTRLSFPGPRIRKQEIELLVEKLQQIPRDSWLVIGGSFPPGFLPSHANRIIRIARSRGILVALDVPGHLLKKINLKGIALIKPNLIEFQELVGKKTESVASIVREAKVFAQGVDLICISSVKGGALLLSQDAGWFGTPPKIKIRSTVGAGDSMVAGILAELLNQQLSAKPFNYDQIGAKLLRSGLAYAAATLSTEGTGLGHVHMIKRFYPKIRIHPV